MGKSIDERSHETIRAYLKHRGIEVLEEGWAHGSDSIGLVAMGDEELVFVDAATKCGGYDIPKEGLDQERFERIAAAYLAESEVEGLTSIRYDIVSLLVRAPRRPSCATTRTSSTTGGDPRAAAPGLRARGRAACIIYEVYTRIGTLILSLATHTPCFTT